MGYVGWCPEIVEVKLPELRRRLNTANLSAQSFSVHFHLALIEEQRLFPLQRCKRLSPRGSLWKMVMNSTGILAEMCPDDMQQQAGEQQWPREGVGAFVTSNGWPKHLT